MKFGQIDGLVIKDDIKPENNKFPQFPKFGSNNEPVVFLPNNNPFKPFFPPRFATLKPTQTFPIPKYNDRIINSEQDKIDLVQDFNRYLKEGQLFFAQKCLKQIIDNDIRVLEG